MWTLLHDGSFSGNLLDEPIFQSPREEINFVRFYTSETHGWSQAYYLTQGQFIRLGGIQFIPDTGGEYERTLRGNGQPAQECITTPGRETFTFETLIQSMLDTAADECHQQLSHECVARSNVRDGRLHWRLSAAQCDAGGYNMVDDVESCFLGAVHPAVANADITDTTDFFGQTGFTCFGYCAGHNGVPCDSDTTDGTPALAGLAGYDDTDFIDLRGGVWIGDYFDNGGVADRGVDPSVPGSCSIAPATEPIVSNDGEWSSWGDWDDCTATCEGGTQTRSRTCEGREGCGAPCDGQDEFGNEEEQQACNTQECPRDGGWSQWDPAPDGSGNPTWTSCVIDENAACGTVPGIRTRSRTCTNPTPNEFGLPCVGRAEERQPCGQPSACPVHGGWSEWTDTTDLPCSALCGGGQITRYRSCTRPSPANGGNDCVGPAQDTVACNTHPCGECAPGDDVADLVRIGDDLLSTRCRPEWPFFDVCAEPDRQINGVRYYQRYEDGEHGLMAASDCLSGL